MNNYKETLVDVLASGTLEEATASTGYDDLVNANGENHQFRSFHESIVGIKEELEDKVDIQASEKNQVSEALRILNSVRLDNNDEMLFYCHLLITGSYEQKWRSIPYTSRHGVAEGVTLFDKFKQADEMLSDAHDYFLSFTRRDPVQGQIMYVNKEHQKLIKSILDYQAYRDYNKTLNLLAKAIHVSLQRQHLGGFFYPEHVGDGSIVDNKLRDACSHSLFFIQLIQNIMFEKPEVENWCFVEYCQVSNPSNKNQIRFVLAEGSPDSLRTVNTAFEYRRWHRHIPEIDCIILKPAKTDQEVEIAMDLIKNLGNQIKEYKEELINLKW